MIEPDFNYVYEIDFGTVIAGTNNVMKFEDPDFLEIKSVELHVGSSPLDVPFNVTINEKSMSCLKLKFTPDIPGHLWCSYYNVINKHLREYIVCVRGCTEDLSLTVSRRLIELRTMSLDENKVTWFDLKNQSNSTALFEFQIDNIQTWVILKPRIGKLGPGCTARIIVTFIPTHYGIFYRCIHCFIHHHEPIIMEAILMCWKGPNLNLREKLNFIEVLPILKDSFKSVFDTNIEKKHAPIGVTNPPIIMDKTCLDLGGMGVESGDAYLKKVFTIRNISPVVIKINWKSDVTQVFKIIPNKAIVEIGGKHTFEVNFKPSSRDNFFYAKLRGMIKWGADFAVTVPFHPTLCLVGHSFDENMHGWVPQYKLPSKVILPPTYPMKRSWTTFLIKRFGHLPLMFRFIPPVTSFFRVEPMIGVIKDDFQIVAVQMSPGMRSVTYREKWKILLNTSTLEEVEFIGTAENPNIHFLQHDFIEFPPTALNCTSEAFLYVKNVTRHPLRFDYCSQEGDLIFPKIRGSCIFPGEQAKLWFYFTPNELGPYNSTRFLTLSSSHKYDSMKKVTNNHIIRVTGSAVHPKLTCIPENLYLGEFHRDEIINNFFVLCNTGECCCNIKLKIIPKEIFSNCKEFKFDPPCLTLRPNESEKVNITLSPDTSGYQSFEILAVICKTTSWDLDEHVTELHLINMNFFTYSYLFKIVDISCIDQNELAVSKYCLWKMLNIDGWNEAFKKVSIDFSDQKINLKIPENEIGSKILKFGFIFENQNTIPCTLSIVKSTPCYCPPYMTKTGYLLERPDEFCPHLSQIWVSPSPLNFKPGEKHLVTMTVFFTDGTISQSTFRLSIFCSNHPSVKHHITLNILRNAIDENTISVDTCHFDESDDLSRIALSEIYIGTPKPPVQAIWVYNNMENNAPYTVTMYGDDVEYFECINPTGTIQGISLHPIILLFTPLCAKEYQIILEYQIDSKNKRLFITGKGVLHHLRNCFVDIEMPIINMLMPRKNIPITNVQITPNRLIIDGMTTHSIASRIISMKSHNNHGIQFKWNSFTLDGYLTVEVSPDEGIIKRGERIILKLSVRTFGNPFIITPSLTCNLYYVGTDRALSVDHRSTITRMSRTSYVPRPLSITDKVIRNNTPKMELFYHYDFNENELDICKHISVSVNCSSYEWIEKLPFGLKKLNSSRRIAPTPGPCLENWDLQPISRSLALTSYQIFTQITMDILNSKRFQNRLSQWIPPKYMDHVLSSVNKDRVVCPKVNKDSIMQVLDDSLFNSIKKYIKIEGFKY